MGEIPIKHLVEHMHLCSVETRSHPWKGVLLRSCPNHMATKHAKKNLPAICQC